MSFIIYLETVCSKQEVVAHLWDPAGDVRDINTDFHVLYPP